MGIFSWIILGALAGWIASKMMNTDKSMGAMANIFVGIVLNHLKPKTKHYEKNQHTVITTYLCIFFCTK